MCPMSLDDDEVYVRPFPRTGRQVADLPGRRYRTALGAEWETTVLPIERTRTRCGLSMSGLMAASPPVSRASCSKRRD